MSRCRRRVCWFFAGLWAGTLLFSAVPPRFRVQVHLVVEGEYAASRPGFSVCGSYVLVLSTCALLERDNGDFILFNLHECAQDDPQVNWRESVETGGKRRTYCANDLIKPQLMTRFALREGGEVRLDLLVSGAAATPGLADWGKTLLFPRSHTGIGDESEKRYRRGILHGSNRLQWKEARMDRPGGTRGRIAWDWGEGDGQWEHTQSVRVTFSAGPYRGDTR